MSPLHAALLGIIEGITEFLPVSSTGHMILLGRLLRIPSSDFVTSFEIIIQLGAIAAVALLYAKTLLKKPKLIQPLLAAFIPTSVVGFLLYTLVKHYLLSNASVVVVSLFVGGVVFLLIDVFASRHPAKTTTVDTISLRQAFFIGLGQTVSMIPGVSRSAASIFSGMLAGLSREAAVEFSFLLAIPTMVAATGLDIIKTPILLSQSTILLLGIGLVFSFLTAYAAVTFFLQFVRKHSFVPFAVYRMALAIIFYFFVLR